MVVFLKLLTFKVVYLFLRHPVLENNISDVGNDLRKFFVLPKIIRDIGRRTPQNQMAMDDIISAVTDASVNHSK